MDLEIVKMKIEDTLVTHFYYIIIVKILIFQKVTSKI